MSEERVFYKAMNTPVARVEWTPDSQVAALVVFNVNATVADAHEILTRLSDQLEATQVLEFDPFFGPPIIYLPT